MASPSLHRTAAASARGTLAALASLVLVGTLASAAAGALPSTTDPRVGLAPGLEDAGVAKLGLDLVAHVNKPVGFFNPANAGDFGFLNTDMAHQGNFAFVGNFNGFQVYDVSNPARPTLRTSVVCPGGQGDLSVYGNLLFMSVEETRAKIDCTLTPAATPATRFRGVRVFDISNLDSPTQVAGVQTCRGSHTHTLVEAPDDPAHVYVYVSGTSTVRPATELAGCDGNNTNTPAGADPSKWRIEVIRVPLANPAAAAVVSTPRLFADGTGAVNGLQNAPQAPLHPSGIPWSPTPIADACHDITVYEELDLAAAACEGNGLLLDIADPANPRRIDAVADPRFAYWHGATFSNDGRTVVFTDEWGGGVAARCRATDDLSWGANAIYDVVDGRLQFRSYFKLPAAQTSQENCVSHIPSLVPVPGRDLFVQAWYQGGAALVDYSDSENPVEIGYFDRGPVSGSALVFGGFWSTYWYNGVTYGSELARGLDVLGLAPVEGLLTQNEIDAAREVRHDRLNVQTQQSFVNTPSFAVARAYVDQLVRADRIDAQMLEQVTKFIDRAERFQSGPQAEAAKANLKALANQLDNRGDQYDTLVATLAALGSK